MKIVLTMNTVAPPLQGLEWWREATGFQSVPLPLIPSRQGGDMRKSKRYNVLG
jgi:hypothetical protein